MEDAPLTQILKTSLIADMQEDGLEGVSRSNVNVLYQSEVKL